MTNYDWEKIPLAKAIYYFGDKFKANRKSIEANWRSDEYLDNNNKTQRLIIPVAGTLKYYKDLIDDLRDSKEYKSLRHGHAKHEWLIKKIDEALKSPSTKTPNANTSAFLKALYTRRHYIEDTTQFDLSMQIHSQMDIKLADSRLAFDRLKRRYFVFREGKNSDASFVEGNFVSSVLDLFYWGNVPWFRHSSEITNDGIPEYVHSGPVVSVADRSYLIGLGQNYIRQWTIKNPVLPDHNQPIPGIFLTERKEASDRFMPMAGKKVMVSETRFDSILKEALGANGEYEDFKMVQEEPGYHERIRSELSEYRSSGGSSFSFPRVKGLYEHPETKKLIAELQSYLKNNGKLVSVLYGWGGPDAEA